jgi:hypothetical protein
MSRKINGLFMEIIDHTVELCDQAEEIMQRHEREDQPLSDQEFDIIMEDAKRLEDFMNLETKISQTQKQLMPKYEVLTACLKMTVSKHLKMKVVDHLKKSVQE